MQGATTCSTAMYPFNYSYAVALAVALCATGVTGCANPTNGQNTHEPHWKAGRIHRVIRGGDLTNISERECVAVLTTEEIERSRFVVVRYSKGRGTQSQTRQISDSSELKVGECVRINLSDCGQPVAIPSSSGIFGSCSW